MLIGTPSGGAGQSFVNERQNPLIFKSLFLRRFAPLMLFFWRFGPLTPLTAVPLTISLTVNAVNNI